MAKPKHKHGSFSAPIPGQGLTKTPGSTPWQQPPKYVHLDDALNYVFDNLTQAPKLMQLLALMKHGVPLEALSRLVIFSGFGYGLWTPDLGMLMVKGVMYILAGIAQRANLNPKITHADRSGFKELVHIHGVFNQTNNPATQTKQKPITAPPPAQMNKVRGLLQPPTGVQ